MGRNAIICSAGISARETSEQWQRAQTLLSGLSRGGAGAQCHELQRWGQRLRDMRAVALVSGAAQRAAGVDMFELSVISYNAGISACERCEEWQRALRCSASCREELGPSVLSSSAEKSASARQATSGFRRCSACFGKDGLETGDIRYIAGVSACGTGEQWQRSLCCFSS